MSLRSKDGSHKDGEEMVRLVDADKLKSALEKTKESVDWIIKNAPLREKVKK